MKREWPVVIIGAGPAGSVAAFRSASAGIPTLLVDGARFPRHKICGCCLHGAGWELLERLGLSAGLTPDDVTPLRESQLEFGGRKGRVPMTGVVISRETLDHHLIAKAIAAGATFLPETRATYQPNGSISLQQSEAEWTVRPEVLVVADGLNGSTIARLTGQKATISEASLIGAGATIRSERVPMGQVRMLSAKAGYVGLVCLPNGTVDVAAAIQPEFLRTKSLAEVTVMIAEEASGEAWPELRSATWRGTPALTRRPDRVSGPGWLAVGDAAGYVEPFTGEGMTWAIASGTASLAAIQAQLRGEPYPWAATLRSLLGPRRMICRQLTQSLRSPVFCQQALRLVNLFPALGGWLMALGQSPIRSLAEERRL
ncbi:MAG: NAD(P)/FAD-dependent oxidoreductase [Fimbriiglobus sp.]